MRLWLRCVDDRQKAWPGTADAIARGARERGVSSVRYGSATWPLAMVQGRVAIVLFVGMGLFVVLQLAIGDLEPLALRVGLTVLFVALYTILSRAMMAARVHAAVRAAGMNLGLCPACGYPIAEIEPQEDMCRVCPECGGAWRMDEGASASRA